MLFDLNQFLVYSIDLIKSQSLYKNNMYINALNIDFEMLHHLRLNALPELETHVSLNNQSVICQ